jgi:hypothetical protein
MLMRVLTGQSRWYAAVRTLWHALVLMYEAEICEVCGHPVAAVWHAEDALWMRVNGHYSGTTCTSCFNKKAREAGASPYWEVRDGEFPSCSGAPCVHERPLVIQAEAADEYWEALCEVVGSRDEARAVVDRRREAVA